MRAFCRSRAWSVFLCLLSYVVGGPIQNTKAAVLRAFITKSDNFTSLTWNRIEDVAEQKSSSCRFDWHRSGWYQQFRVVAKNISICRFAGELLDYRS